VPRRSGDEPAHEQPVQLLAFHIHPGPAQSGPLHPQLKTLLALWSQARGDRIMPAVDDLPERTLQPWRGHLALIEPGPGSLRFRQSGSDLIPRFGCDTTGLTLADLAADIRKGLHATIDIVHARRTPVAAASSVRFEGKRRLYSDLLLPLSGGRFRSTLLLLGSYPVTARPGAQPPPR
jgi:hypothetical protein